MAVSSYIVLNSEFVTQSQGYTRDNLIFGYAVMLSGVSVCAETSYEQFPELNWSLLGFPIQVVYIDDSEFPNPKPPSWQ